MGGEDCKWITKGPAGGPVAPACVVPCWLILGWCQQTHFTLSLYRCLPQSSSLLPPHRTPTPVPLPPPTHPASFPLISPAGTLAGTWEIPAQPSSHVPPAPHPLPRTPSLQGHFCFIFPSSPGHFLCQPKQQRIPMSPDRLKAGLSVLRASLWSANVHSSVPLCSKVDMN